MILKIVLEVIFLVNISVVQSSKNDTLEKYFITANLKAGGYEDLAKNDYNYDEFKMLPNVTKSSYTCNDDCMIHVKLMNDIQSEVSLHTVCH